MTPVGDSLFASSLVAAIPIVVLFVLLGGVKMKAHWASLIALLAALLIAIIVYSMPVGQALDSGLEGAAFGIFPIMYIVFVALWIYNMTVETGHFAVLRRAFNRVSDDQRVQAPIIAFSFGALLEALAGFGTPVAITAVMLIALGFEPIKAASVALVANTAPVAFGAIAIPIVTLAQVTGLPQDDLGAMVGRQTPLLALVVPLILVGMVDGGRGIRQAWPAAIVGGLTFAIGQFVCSNYISVELTDIVASLLSAASIVALVQVWSPSEPLHGEANGRGPQPAIAGAAVAVDRRRVRHPAVPVRDHRLARRGGDRLRHLVELAVRHAAGRGRAEGRLLADAARRRELVRRCARQDDLAPEPRHWRCRSRHGRPGGRALPEGGRLEHRAHPRHVRDHLPAVDRDT